MATKHEIYITHIAPSINKATVAAQPYLDQHVYPALKAARTYTDPALKTAQDASSNAYKRVEEEVLPVLTGHGNTVVDAMNGNVLHPIFDRTAKVAPNHAHILPKSKVDRVLFLVLFVVCVYYALILTGFTVRISMKTVKATWRWIIAPPMRLVMKIVNFWLWLTTGCYCCGLCRSKSSPKSKGGNVSPDAKGKAKKDPESATADDLTKLLEASKGKGKLDAAVKLLVEKVTKNTLLEGKNFPDYVQGKKVQKDVLKKTLNKFKEVDQKKLGL